MKDKITIDGKIGYLNSKTGRYMYVTITEITETGFKMKEVIRQGKFHVFINVYEEKTENVIKLLKTPSPDFKDGRTLMKYKGTTKNYIQ